jgi:hypothetical protein
LDANEQIRCFFQYTGALSQADAQTWVTAMNAAWGTRWSPQQTTFCTLTNVVLTDLTSATAAQANDATARVGTNGTSPAPLGAAIIIKRRIARRYRGGHSKVYIPGASIVSMGTNNQWVGASLTAFLAAWNNLISDILTAVPVAAAPAFEVSVSYFQGFHNVTFPSGRIRPVPTLRGSPLIDLVLGHAVNPVVASQRRRNETP